jgi:hypothetical protein
LSFRTLSEAEWGAGLQPDVKAGSQDPNRPAEGRSEATDLIAFTVSAVSILCFQPKKSHVKPRNA